MNQYLTPFIIAFILTVIFMPLLVMFAKKINWKERNSRRHIHSSKIFRVGGLAMITAFVLTILFDSNLVMSAELAAILIGSLTLMVVGLMDDIKEVFWKIQLSSQIAVAIFIFVMGVRIYYVTNPISGGVWKMDSGLFVLISIFLVIFWVVLVINALNWLDGTDGLSGGVAFIAAGTIFFLSLKSEVNQPPVAIVSAGLAGSFLGFLIYNFHPARVLAGTTGSMFMGFSLAALAIFSGTKIATALLVMAMPIIDFGWVILDRLRKQKSIFRPDKNHLHYKLLRLGWSQRKIAVFYYAVTGLIALVALNTRTIGKSITLGVTFFIMISAFVLLDKKINKLKKENK